MTAPGRLRRHRSALLVALGLIVAVAVVLLTTERQQSGYLDPDDADPGGARAVAQVLDDQGVRVTVVRDADELERTRVTADTTVVVAPSDHLGRSTADRLFDHADGARVVLLGPGRMLADVLDLPAPTTAALAGGLEAACADPTYADLSITVDVALAYPGPGCFPTGDGHAVLTEPRPGLVLLGAEQVLTNDQVLRADNAALALRLLGGTDELVWYVPSPADLDAEEAVGLSTLLPDWLGPALLLVAIATLTLLVWRGRRLGPLAVEPLPVAVRAIESTRSRGRLYRRAADRGHAAYMLRAAARARAAERLHLGARPDPAALVRDVARHTGRSDAEIAALLGEHAPSPATDHDLITLADRLAELDREVRRA